MGTYVHALLAVVALSAPDDATIGQDGRRRVFPHVHIDRSKGTVDVTAFVVFDPTRFEDPAAADAVRGPRRCGWVELVATTPGMREHEALVAVRARPRHIHQALLMIGLLPGAPRRVIVRGEDVEVSAAHGPPVEVTFVIRRDGGSTEVPVGAWIVDRRTGKGLAGRRWRFAGSTFHRVQDRELYLADLNGTVVSLVQFGDDLICRATSLTHRDDGQVFAANLETLPSLGTEVTLRLRALPPDAEDGPMSRPASPPPSAPTSQPASPDAPPVREEEKRP